MWVPAGGPGEREAAECMYVLKQFFMLVDDLKTTIIDSDIELPESYIDAFERVKKILVDLAELLSGPHFFSPLINPNVAPIIRYERDQLKQIMTRIEEAKRALDEGIENTSKGEPWHKKLGKLFRKGFNSADIIIDSLGPSLPGLSFVGEFKKQVANLTDS